MAVSLVPEHMPFRYEPDTFDEVPPPQTHRPPTAQKGGGGPLPAGVLPLGGRRDPYQPATGFFDNALFAGVSMLQERPTNVPCAIQLSAKAMRESEADPDGYMEALGRQALQRTQFVLPNAGTGNPGEVDEALAAVLQEAG